MKDLQAKMLAALDRMPADGGSWRSLSMHKLRAIIEANPDAQPVPLRRVIRRGYPFERRSGFAYRTWCAVVREAIAEATGLAALKRAQKQDEDAVLFKQHQEDAA